MTPTFPPFFFFFNDTATTEIYTISLHDALPISRSTFNNRPWFAFSLQDGGGNAALPRFPHAGLRRSGFLPRNRSEEHTSELQSLRHLVCRLLLEKNKA